MVPDRNLDVQEKMKSAQMVNVWVNKQHVFLAFIELF